MWKKLTLRFNSDSWHIADLLTLLIILVIALGIGRFITLGSAPFVPEMEIFTDLAHLPGYALLSLTRSFIALFLSLSFALIYGGLAARSRATERVMIPVLDVLQSLPLLVFLAPTVLTLISVFKNSRWGLELACILMIFTGQVWNLVFAYYESQKSMAVELREATKLMHLSPAQRFFLLDLPNGVRPLVFNGMLSMAGGWFFLTTIEAFTLGEKNFLLPGLGSFLSMSFQQQNYTSFGAGLLCMVVMILGVDFIVWRPLIAWSARFKDTAGGSKDEESYFLEIFRKTMIPSIVGGTLTKLLALLKKPSDRLQQKNYDSLLKAGIEIQQILTLRKPLQQRTIGGLLRGISNLPWMRWSVSIALALFLLYVLPRAPDIGKAMGVLESEDWLELTNALLLSNLKVVGSLIIASLWTVPVGLWIGKNARIAHYAIPISQNIAAFPAPIFFPLIVMVIHNIGISEGLIATFLMTVGTQWYILFNVISGAKAVPHELELVAKSCRMSLFEKWKHLYIPALLPSLTTGWMTAVGGAWNVTIVAEMVKYPGGVMEAEGIGAEITRASEAGDYPRLIASIIVFIVGVIIINRTVWRPLQLHVEKVKA